MNLAAEGSAVSEEAGQAMWEAWCSKATPLQQLINDCAIFLPAFDVRKAQSTVSTLLEKANATKLKIVPRQKFKFRSKATTAAAPAPVAASAGGADGGSASAATTQAVAAPAAAPSHRYDEDEYTIENKTGEVIYVAPGHFSSGAGAAASGTDGGEGRDICLLNLTDCVVVLMDVMRALRIDGLTRCRVYAAPIAGSVLLHRCEDCLFALPARQIRIHTSHRCAYYLHVLSRPIIEHCTTLSFAPYCLEYDSWRHQVAAAGLERPARHDMYRCVDDFGWHRVQKSPNWRELLDDEHVTRDSKAVGAADGPVLARYGVRFLPLASSSASTATSAISTGSADGSGAAAAAQTVPVETVPSAASIAAAAADDEL